MFPGILFVVVLNPKHAVFVAQIKLDGQLYTYLLFRNSLIAVAALQFWSHKLTGVVPKPEGNLGRIPKLFLLFWMQASQRNGTNFQP